MYFYRRKYKMADLIKQAGFGDDSLPDGQIEKYKAKVGKIDRIALVWIEENTDSGKKEPQFVYANTYYVDKQGYILHKEGFNKVLKKDPKTRYATIVLVYSTDNNGEFFKDENDKPMLSYEVKPWYFSEKKFKDLRMLHKKWNLAQHDLEVNCSDEQFQTITIQPHQKSALTTLLKNEKHGKKIKASIDHLKRELLGGLGRDIEMDQLREIMGSGSTQDVPDEELSIADDEDVLDTIDSLDLE